MSEDNFILWDYTNDQNLIQTFWRSCTFMDLQIPILSLSILFKGNQATSAYFPAVALVADSDWLMQVSWRWWCTHSLSKIPYPALDSSTEIGQGRSCESWGKNRLSSVRLSVVRIKICDTQKRTYGQVVTGSTWLKFCHSPSCQNEEHITHNTEQMVEVVPGLTQLSIHGVKLPEQ